MPVNLPLGLLIAPWDDRGFGQVAATNVAVIDAVGESLTIIGQLSIEGNATGKVLSAAGGGSFFYVAGTSVNIDNAGSTLRVGLQDVDLTTGLEDGVFDVYADVTGPQGFIGPSKIG